MPDDWQRTLLALKLAEMIHEGVNHAMRQRVLLVQHLQQEKAVGARVRHFRNLQDGHARVQDGDGDARQQRGPDHRLAHRARSRRAQRQQQPFVESPGLVHRFLERLEQRKVQTLVLFDVGAASGQQHQVVEALGHLGVEVGGKQASRRVHGVRGPPLRVGDEQHLLPVAEGGDDLERLGHFSRVVSSQQPPHLGVHLVHLLVHAREHAARRGHVRITLLVARPTLLGLHLRRVLLKPLHDEVRQRARLARLRVHEPLDHGCVLRGNLHVSLAVLLVREVVLVAVAVVAIFLVLKRRVAQGGAPQGGHLRASGASALCGGFVVQFVQLLGRRLHDARTHRLGHVRLLICLAAPDFGCFVRLRLYYFVLLQLGVERKHRARLAFDFLDFRVLC
mmetsp:Transcript_16898/g.32703  ORF Transcript_16898/g.32703 Transcript_16898/m.32703 type:complete len:392 (+) Transcript_16898:419-1594(+)